jgi:quercetin dioxygenase-like cupin family protein
MIPVPGRIFVLAAFAAVVLACSPANGLAGPLPVVQMLPGDMKWQTPAGPRGMQSMVLVGDPNSAAPYAERIRLPANTRLEPHSHPNEARMVTVISGTLYYARGERFDESKLTALPPGSFFTEPKDMPHYALTREEVILQLNAVGPAGTRYVDANRK